MTVIYCLLSFAVGVVFGLLAIAVAVMGSDKSKRDERR